MIKVPRLPCREKLIAVVTGGIGAEIAASVASAAPGSLRAPIERVGAPFVPPPAGPDLEALFVPTADHITAAVRRTLQVV